MTAALHLVEDVEDDGQALVYPHPTDAELEALYARNPVLLRIDVDGHTVLLRKLRTPEWQRVQSMANAGGTRAEGAGAQMFADCVVWPQGENIQKLTEEYPGAAERCAEDLLRWTRGEALKQGKKSRRASKPQG